MDLVQQGPARVSNPLYLQSPGQPSPLYQVEDDVDEVSLQAVGEPVAGLQAVEDPVAGLCVGVVHRVGQELPIAGLLHPAGSLRPAPARQEELPLDLG